MILICTVLGTQWPPDLCPYELSTQGRILHLASLAGLWTFLNFSLAAVALCCCHFSSRALVQVELTDFHGRVFHGFTTPDIYYYRTRERNTRHVTVHYRVSLLRSSPHSISQKNKPCMRAQEAQAQFRQRSGLKSLKAELSSSVFHCL